MEKIDAYSLAILEELQRDARQTVQQIADKINLSTTPCWKRIKELESSGIIRGYTALVDRARVGLKLQVVAEVNLTQHVEEQVRRFEDAVMACPQIVRCVSTTGAADYILTVMVRDIEHYDRLLHEVLFKLPGVAHLRSSIALKEVKDDMRLPLAEAAPHPQKRRAPPRR